MHQKVLLGFDSQVVYASGYLAHLQNEVHRPGCIFQLKHLWGYTVVKARCVFRLQDVPKMNRDGRNRLKNPNFQLNFRTSKTALNPCCF